LNVLTVDLMDGACADVLSRDKTSDRGGSARDIAKNRGNGKDDDEVMRLRLGCAKFIN
jgi:hypothetical protein